ncbi:CPBP family intramembrane glutamic endopeptidase [Litorisediminicola beolgyonensis]|uniref:CPBP family intramembrane glutamic endopeptidase n=1 Tax=Litorisediminicola beolgyonensis TaxID=1173614 RepID=A0ABW3ZI79_9RHOB
MSGPAPSAPAPRRYAAHEALVAPGRSRPELWRLGLGIVLAVATTFLIGQIALTTALILGGTDTLTTLITGEGPQGLILLLMAMGGMALGAALAARLLHSRSFGSLLGPRAAFVPQFLNVLLWTGAINLGVVVFVYGLGDMELQENLPMGRWLGLLPLAIVAILIQTGSEEILFRGYLQSQLAARFRSRLVWMLVPSAAFALGHFAPAAYGGNALSIVAWTFAFGLAAADLTARAGTLGPAIALHFTNNAIVLLWVSLDGPMSGLARYTLPFGADDVDAVSAAMPVDFALLGIGWLAARVAIRR